MTKEKLLNAQYISIQLFKAIESHNLIVGGKSEEQLNADVCDLALNGFGIEKHWHKKIVRSGKNTLAIYPDNPPNRVIDKNDILFIDLGPIVQDYEADIGRTYVLGNEPRKLKLKRDVETAWYDIQEWYQQQTTLKASELFQYAVEMQKNLVGNLVAKLRVILSENIRMNNHQTPRAWNWIFTRKITMICSCLMQMVINGTGS